MRKLLVYLLCFSFMIPLSTFAVNSADDANYEEKYITIKRVNDDQEDVYKVITDGEKVYLSVTDLLEIANFEDKVFDVNAETHALNKVILTKKKDHHGFNQDIVINANDKTISSDLYGQSEFDGYIDLKDDVYLEIIDIFNYLRIKAAVLDEKLYVNIPVYTFLDFLVEDYQSALMNTVSQLDLLEYGESSNHSGLIDALALACKNFDIKLLIPWWGANELKDEQYKKAIMTLKEEDSVFYDEDTKQYMKEELEKRGFEGVLASGEDLVNLMSIGGNTLETVEDVFEELANASEIDRKTYESFMEVVNWDGEIFHGASQLKAWSKQAEGISDVISIADVVISAYETYSRANSWNDERLKDLEILSSLNEENYADHKDYIERIKKVADECYQESEKNGDAVRDQIAKDTVSLLAEKAITETSVYGKVADLFVLAINTGVSVARCFGNVAENMDKAELSYMVTCLINIAVASRIDAEIKYDKLDLKQLHTSKDLDDFRNSMVTYLKSNLRCWSYIYYLNSDGKWENSLSGKEVKSKIDKMNTYLTLIDESAQYDYALDKYDVNTFTFQRIIGILEDEGKNNNKSKLEHYLYDVLIPQYGFANVGNVPVVADVKFYSLKMDWYQDKGLLSAYFVDDNKMIISRLADDGVDRTSKMITEMYYVDKNDGGSVKKASELKAYFNFLSGGVFCLYALSSNDRQYLCVETNTTGVIASGIHKEILITEITDTSLEIREKIDCSGSSEFYVYSRESEIGTLMDSDIAKKINDRIKKYGLKFSFVENDSYGFPNFNIAVDDEAEVKLTKICEIGVPVDETTEKPENGKLNFTIRINDYTEMEREDDYKKNSSLDYGQFTIEDYGANADTNSNSPTVNLASSIVGTWVKDDGILVFTGGATGTYSFDSVGMYDETGSYSIASDGTLTMTSRQQGTRTCNYASADAIKNGESGWCVDGNTLYLGASYIVYSRK